MRKFKFIGFMGCEVSVVMLNDIRGCYCTTRLVASLSILLRDNDMIAKDFDESVQKVFKECSCPEFVKNGRGNCIRYEI